MAWREWPHTFPHPMPPTSATNNAAAYPIGSSITQAAWEHAIAEGTMWKYVGDYNIYRCPSAGKDQYVTYNMSMSMNTYPGASGTGAVVFTNINQIIKPDERFVFLDTGYASRGAFYVNYNGWRKSPGKWYDKPPMIHNHGNNICFCRWPRHIQKMDRPHALAAAATSGAAGPSITAIAICDGWTKITWGSVPFSCADPSKNCEY